MLVPAVASRAPPSGCSLSPVHGVALLAAALFGFYLCFREIQRLVDDVEDLRAAVEALASALRPPERAPRAEAGQADPPPAVEQESAEPPDAVLPSDPQLREIMETDDEAPRDPADMTAQEIRRELARVGAAVPPGAKKRELVAALAEARAAA